MATIPYSSVQSSCCHTVNLALEGQYCCIS
ncbi:hypothetical protein COLO4_02944 [Corchorus olitorius]|uniref:Uncharacterized protein n=1 Tax=Corchorus olitorius TaxID=93759 RepID=A0A1R3KZW4_9ROSI|nr:hypothetical protein COLO4_02944 [Corchorus olitorius]